MAKSYRQSYRTRHEHLWIGAGGKWWPAPVVPVPASVKDAETWAWARLEGLRKASRRWRAKAAKAGAPDVITGVAAVIFVAWCGNHETGSRRNWTQRSQ